jgi:hypothetical protein
VGGVTGVLVALQRSGDDRSLPAAAAHLVRLLGSWGPGPDHLTGLTLAGITVPGRGGPRFVDALVFTRYGVVVIAAHEPGAGPAPAPDERAGAGVAAAKGALAAHDGGRYVTGLVAIVPAAVAGPGSEPDRRSAQPGPPDTAGWPAPANQPDPARREAEAASPGPAPGSSWPAASVPGVAVVLADPQGLRRIIRQHNRWRTVWSADDVLDACYALSLAHLAPPRAALLADGFPARLPALAKLPELPAVIPVPPDPPPPVVDDDPEPRIPRPRGPVSAVFPRPRPIRQVPWGLVIVLALLVTAGLLAAVVVAQVFHGS